MSKESKPSSDRDEFGRFRKGHKIDSPRRGRPHKTDSFPILLAVTQEYSIAELRKMLRDTYDMAQSEKDWKGMFQVLQFVMNYAVGKPVQRTLSATIDPSKIREIFGMDEDEDVSRDDDDDDNVIDVELPTSL